MEPESQEWKKALLEIDEELKISQNRKRKLDATSGARRDLTFS